MIKSEEVLPGWVVGWPKGSQPMYAHFEVVHLEDTLIAVFFYVGDGRWRVALGTDMCVARHDELRPGMFVAEPKTAWTVHPTQWEDPLAAQAWVMLHGPEKLVLELTSK